MSITELTRELLAAGYIVHQASNPDGTTRCWADHETRGCRAHATVSGFGDFDGTVTADYSGHHDTYSVDTDEDLVAAARLAAARVDEVVAA